MLGNPTQAPRLVPFGSARLSTDRLPNGRPSFRVTQRFSDLDAYFHDRIHGAIDFANFYCGDVLLAPIAGRVEHLTDPNGALCLRIVSSDGKHVVELWHVSSRLVPAGATVTKGQKVATVGSTGLDIAGCHCHMRYIRFGTPVDPWPWLDQNIARKAKFNSVGPVNIRTGPGVPGGSIQPVYATFVNGVITRFDGVVLTRTGTILTAKLPVRGATHGVGAAPSSWTPVYLNGAYRAVAGPLMTYV